MINIIGKRYYFFGLSLLIIIPGLILLFVMAAKGSLPLSIDFTGGSLLEVSLSSGIAPDTEDVFKLYDQVGITDPQVQLSDSGTVIIKSSPLSEDQRTAILQSMETAFNDVATVVRFESVDATIGKEVATRAALAVSIAAVIVILFISYAFRGVQHAVRYGVCAIVAMIHDVAVVFSVSAFGGMFLGWQYDALFLTAVLTVIGFSVQDKVVVFDRIRENSGIHKKLGFETLVNHSVIQTLQRSINTQLMTVEFMLLALALFGGITLREFSVILLVGLLCGTYSSIFTAAPILVVWETKEWKKWFKKESAQAIN